MINSFYNAVEYNIVPDGTTDNTKAFKELTEKVGLDGGGIIFLPTGKYVTGSICLESNTTLFISPGAVILGSEKKENYLSLKDKNLGDYGENFNLGLVGAVNAENITITGGGTIDGRGYNWWHDPENQNRPRAVQPINCSKVIIRDIKIINSAMWTVHPLCCNNVTIDAITIKNPSDSPNTDGINPESCQNVHISNCYIDVGDDCVTIKAGTEEENFKKSMPCENITVTNCTMLNGHGGVVIGSEMSGGVRNVVVNNCVFNGTDRGVRIKTRRLRGGCLEDMMFSNIIMDKVWVPVCINEYYFCNCDRSDEFLFSEEEKPVTEKTPVIKNININNISAKNACVSAIYMKGLPELPISGITLSNISIDMKENEISGTQIPILAPNIPQTKAEGIYIENAKDCTLNNVTVTNQNGKDITLVNCENIELK